MYRGLSRSRGRLEKRARSRVYRLGLKQMVLLGAAFIFVVLGTVTFSAASSPCMDDYCVVPSFVTTTLKPNVLVLMDFSGSMQFPAYVPCNNTGYYGAIAECNDHNSGETAHGATAYDANRDYYGYFDYKKDSSDNSKYYKWASDRFQVNTACTNTDRIGSGSDCISGNLLNWITATRIDSARKVLTGGRTSTGGGGLKYESEGAVYVYTDKNLHCKFTTTAVTTANRNLQIENESSTLTCPISLSSSRINIDESDATRATGVLQAFEDKAIFEFMVFAGDNREGIMRSGKDATFSSLLAAINNESPYWGTPTGPGMWEASDFFKQVSSDSAWHSTNYQNNNDSINSTSGVKDPYYEGTGKPGTKMPCRKTYVLLISDGNWNEGPDPVKPAHKMHVSDLRTDLDGIQNATTYVVYAFGDLDSGTKTLGRNAMITTAIFGGFDRTTAESWPYPFTDYPANSQNVTYPLTNCNPAGTWNEQCKKWDKNKSGLPYNFYEADEGEGLTASISQAFNDMMRKASSGTAASVLASSEGSGANLLQAVFYPKRVFGGDEVAWIGEIHDLWYYVDPFIDNASLREDTTADKILNLSNDYVIRFYYDTGLAKTRVQKWTDTNYDGSGDVLTDSDDLEDVSSLWSAGKKLFQRNLVSSPRKIYTTLNGTSFLTGDFSVANWSTLKNYLGSSVDEATAKKIINYVIGVEQTGARSRTVTLGTTTAPWRLGDIISSTPRMQSSVPLNSYHRAAPDGYGDSTYSQFISDSAYQNQGMVYAGANDGMFHAFHLGKLEEKWSAQGTYEKGKLTELSGKEVGTEAWAFIPKHSLPYLKYLTEDAYCHIHYIDLPPVLVDASINGSAGDTRSKTSWRTVVIGGMGLGGAPRRQLDSCSTNTSCVKAPMDDPDDSTKALGYSSYFAFDVTDPVNPTLLWEFADPDLGYSTSGPAIVRVGDSAKNGNWYAVVASGPTGPIDKAYRQFLGRSDQNLFLFVIDLKTGSLVRKIDTTIENAFGGSLYNATVDVDRWRAGASGHYKDDGLYLGYTKKATDGTWTQGGVLRMLTKESSDVSSWAVSYVKENIGAPVTAGVTRLQNTRDSSLWLYFGTGRFYYKRASDIDDATNKRTIYGVREKCYKSGNTLDSSCDTQFSVLKDQTTSPSPSIDFSAYDGWYIDLPTSATIEDQEYKAERVMTDPSASFNGAVFYTTFAPSADVCAMGGNTFLWGVKYDTGGPPPQLRGKALLQVSSGEIKEIALGTAFKTSTDNPNSQGNRRSASIKGVPPTRQGLSLLVAPKPLQKVLHIREK